MGNRAGLENAVLMASEIGDIYCMHLLSVTKCPEYR